MKNKRQEDKMRIVAGNGEDINLRNDIMKKYGI